MTTGSYEIRRQIPLSMKPGDITAHLNPATQIGRVSFTAGTAQLVLTVFPSPAPRCSAASVTNDPFEMRSLADLPENAEIFKTLQQQLSEWRTRQGDNVPVYLNQEYVAPK